MFVGQQYGLGQTMSNFAVQEKYSEVNEGKNKFPCLHACLQF